MNEPTGDPMFVVTIVTTDPTYLSRAFVITSQFKKEDQRCKVEADGMFRAMVGVEG